MTKTKFLITASLGFATLLGAQAQSAVVTSGGNTTGNGTVSYTVGQTVFAPITSAKGNIETGVQHAYQITVVGMADEMRISLRAIAYPNPTTDFLSLRVDGMNTRDMRYTVLSLGGQTLMSDKLAGEVTSIDMTALQPDVYLLQVTDGTQTLKTFKIVKK